MKYVYYTVLVLWDIISKLIGIPMFYLLSPFRKWARNRVYNYWFDNNRFVKRFNQRNPKLSEDGTKILLTKPVHHLFDPSKSVPQGYFHKRTVNKATYYVAFFVWGWFDDDSTQETWSAWFNGAVLKGEKEQWTLKIPGVREAFKRDLAKLEETNAYGRVFDQGDLADYSISGWSTFLWLLRNTAYNFAYAKDTNDESIVWVKEFPQWKTKKGHVLFGWEQYKTSASKTGVAYKHRFIMNF